MIFPYLTDGSIDAQACSLLGRTFGPALDRTQSIDLEDVIAFLSETEELSYKDDADLGMEDGEVVLGKTLPISRRILLSRAFKGEHDPGRARFTLAHEIGHWVLHRPLFVAKAKELSLFGTSDDNEFAFVGLNKSIFPDGSRREIRREEWQANRFATALLIDGEVLRNEFVARFGVGQVARATQEWRYRSRTTREHARLLGCAQVGPFRPLREVFGLSGEAMAIALESRGYAVERAPLL